MQGRHPLLFYSAAVFNLCVGIFFILQPKLAHQLVTGSPAPDSAAVTWMFGMVIIVFGLGYASAGHEFESNRAIVKLATIGKATAFIIGAVSYFTGAMTLPALGGASMDLIYALLFARTLGWWGNAT
ncbi:MAG: hypothetical protein AAF292_09350 [Pseudomonadota bacterium]